MALSRCTKIFLYGLAIFLVAVLLIGLIAAFVKKNHENKNNGPNSTTTERPIDYDKFRLNRTIWPDNYRLKIIANPGTEQFSGNVQIDLRFIFNDNNENLSSINVISLHCKELLIKSAKFTNVTDVEITVHADNEKELCSFTLSKPILVNSSYTLEIDYNGSFRPGQITGLYRSHYQTAENEIKHFIATKFEPTYARWAFPCFDEPEFKATFEITIQHPPQYVALSNERELHQTAISDGQVETKFDKTKKMSTYLVAIVIGQFDYTESLSKSGTRIRVYSRPDQVAKTEYAVETAADLLSYYEDFTKIPYKFSKLDLIGLPEFVSGAMENWGLVTYKETYILFDKEKSNLNDKQKIAKVIAHELAHMWFGNLVTLKWWNHLWLQEGLVSYIQFYGMNHLNSSWNYWNRFGIDHHNDAIKLDSLENTHLLVPDEVQTPDEITAMFDAISYSKGAAIFQMFEDIIGKDRFQHTLQKYLAENEYSVTDSSKILEYFYDDIEKITGMKPDVFMDQWLYRSSFPVVSVQRDEYPNSRYYKPFSKQLILKQVTYSKLYSDKLDEPWTIYISYRHPKIAKPKPLVMDDYENKIELDYELDSNDWIKLNPDGHGYYLVNYEPKDWDLLIKELKKDPKTFTVNDRANLLFDAIQLSYAFQFSTDRLLDLFDYLKQEENYIPWTIAGEAMIKLDKKLAESGITWFQYRKFIKNLISTNYDSIIDFNHSDNDNSLEQLLLQNKLISIACYFGYEKCLQDCYSEFRNWLDRGKQLSPNVKSFVYQYGLKSSTNETDWFRVWDLYQTELDAIEKSKLLSALTRTDKPNLIRLLISYSGDRSKINNEHFFSVQQSIANNSPLGRDLVWNYIKNHWLNLVDRFSLNDRRLGKYVKSVVGGFQTKAQLNEVLEFFEKYPNAGAGLAARTEAIDSIKNNINWMNCNLENISKSLQSKDYELNPWLNWRLDELVRPYQYEVNLTIDVDNEQFEGSVRIHMDILKPVRYVVLHSKNLDITKSDLYTKSSVNVTGGKSFSYEPNQFWIIPLNGLTIGNNYFAELRFKGRLSRELTGLYLSKYTSAKNNRTVKLAASQFEAGYTRKTFPCFDEPQFKSTFKIAIQHADKYSALSNMPVVKVENIGEKMKRTTFQETPKMSTYIVALIVSDFVPNVNPIVSNFSIYTYNPDENLEKLNYSVMIGPKILDFYAKQYFEIDYPLPKMDMITVPDFSLGAMENWGMVTYRDVFLMYDPLKTSSLSKTSICRIVSHELAHMWFGNIVTMKWWDDLWLNEGFATFMQYKAVDHVEPEWNFYEYYLILEVAKVYEYDSLPNTHPILTHVTDAESIQSVFDLVTYAKGATIIRMLESMLGEQKFRSGIKNYIHKYSYSNTLTNDLWRELSATDKNNENIEEFMDTWVSREGFPVITIKELSNSSFSLEQDRFLKDFSNSYVNYVWSIPITYQLFNLDLNIKSSIKMFNIKEKQMIQDNIDNEENNLIKYNIEQKGLYVVNYPEQQWEKWINALNDNNSFVWSKNGIGPMDRHNLLIDAFYLARSGRLDYTKCLRLVEFLKYETSFIVWETAAEMLKHLNVFLTREDNGIAYHNWIQQKLIHDNYHNDLWKYNANDSLNQLQFRAKILNLACTYNNFECIQEAKKRFIDYEEKNLLPDPDILPIVLKHTIRNDQSVEKFDFIYNKYLTAKTTNEKLIYLNSLSATKNLDLIKKLLNNSMDVDYLRVQDFFTFMEYISANDVARNLAWNFYREYYPEISKRFGLDNSKLGKAVYYFAFYFTNKHYRQELLEFYGKYPDSGASKLFRQQALDLIDANIKWSDKFYDEVITYLTDNCDKELCPWNIDHLSKTILPSHYNLLIQINTTNNLYNGTISIDVDVKNATDNIILNAAEILNVSNVTIRDLNHTTILTNKTFSYSPFEYLVIPLKETLIPGQYLIEAHFNGSMENAKNEKGLYRGWYNLDRNNQSKQIGYAATQFEYINSRKMFPCFDEPSFKSNISITIVHDKMLATTLSNLNNISSLQHQSVPEWVVTKYQTTPPMSTYLISILVSDFICSSKEVKSLNGNNLLLQTCSTPLINPRKHEYSLKATENIIKYFENYTQIPYMLPKLDQVALPQIFAAAMENWGLINYLENKLLWSEDEDDSNAQIDVCAIIGHEVAHMWFGNLVTMNSWGELWLKEAFAQYMSFAAINSVHPELKSWDTFAIGSIRSAILGDIWQNSLPLINSGDDLEVFSYSTRIVYHKGATILRMVEHLMGEDRFRDSIRQYLQKFSYQTVTSKDLFDIFQNNWNYNFDFETFMNSWTYQRGFPYLNLLENGTELIYVQQQFVNPEEKLLNENQTYVIPFSYYTFNDNQLERSSNQFLSEKSGKISLPVVGGLNSIVKINPEFFGFYFVNYPAEKWETIIDSLVSNQNNIVSLLNVNDRSELILSAYWLARTKIIDYLIPFKLFNYLIHEQHSAPWILYSKFITNMALEFDRTEYRDSYRRFQRRLTSPHYSGPSMWDDTKGTILDKIFRRNMITYACNAGNRQCLKDAYEQFSQWKTEINTRSKLRKLSPNLFGVTLCNGIRESKNEDDLEFIWNEYLTNDEKLTPKSIFLDALSCTRNNQLALKYLNRALNETLVPLKHFVYYFTQLVHRYDHESLMWKYFKDNYSMLSRKLSSNSQYMNDILKAFADHTITENRKAELWEFLGDKQSNVTSNGQVFAFAAIEYNQQWMSKYKDKVGRWLTENACGNGKPEPCPWSKLQIDKEIIRPMHYDINIQVNLTTNIYNGTVKILVKAEKDFQFILLHAADMLNVELISVQKNNAAENDSVIIEKDGQVSMFRYLPNNYLVVEFYETQTTGTFELEFRFNANLLDAGLSGLYRSNYTDGQNEFKIASTQLEFYDARKVFPCFDEPAFKSKFSLTIVHDKEFPTVLSNMKLLSKNIEGNWIRSKFEESPVMSSYLVAMLISDFVCQTTNSESITYGVCASPLQKHKFDYALQKAPICLQHLESKLGVKYPMRKVDLIGIPDFFYGAMENWGLITFRESSLLFHESDTTSERKMRLMETIAHEIGHFWFGNLVTCEWWNYIALNEAFATYMQYTSLDAAEPDWKMFELFLISDFDRGLNADSKDNHAIIRNITETKQIDRADSNIIYSKGASILRMIESIMGSDQFYSALREYLAENAFKSVKLDNLLEKMNKHYQANGNSSHVLSDLLHHWFYSNGFPYVNVTEGKSNDEIYLVQDRFLLQATKNETKPIWSIPISYYLDDNSQQIKMEFMTDNETSLIIKSQAKLVKLNAGHSGFYLVNYSPKIWNQWIDYFQNNNISLPVSDRAGLLMDSFYLAKANLLSYSIPLNLAKYLKNESHITPWIVAIRSFRNIINYIQQKSLYRSQFQQYIQDLVQPIYNKLGWTDNINSSVVERRLRANILDFACSNELSDCLSKSNQLFQDWIESVKTNDLTKMPTPNLLNIVIKYGLKYSNTSDDWLFVWSRYLNETSSSLRTIYMDALTNARGKQKSFLNMLMHEALEAKVIRSQDSYSALISMIYGGNAKLLWKFIQDNFDKMIDLKSPLKLNQISSLLSSLSQRYFFTIEQRKEMELFFSKHSSSNMPGVNQVTASQQKNIINIINNNYNWIKHRLIQIERFLLCGSDNCPFTNFRLNPNVIPTKYRLELKVDLDRDTFNGTVEIDVDLKENVRYIVLHKATTLNINDSVVFISEMNMNRILKLDKSFAYTPYEFWVLKLEEEISFQNNPQIHLRFQFTSKLSTDMHGFYLSKYYDSNRQKMVKLASTQFQDVYARRAFPCFDEPAFKSVFKVKIEHDEKYNAISNTNSVKMKRSTPEEGYVVTEFTETPKMVTYLLAFIISDFQCQTNGERPIVHVCSSPPELAHTEYALEKAPELIRIFENRFGIEYPLNKMHLVAIPDFSAGAMENWGLLTFRENALLWNPNHSTVSDKMYALSVVSHEISHMWHGNLVTCKWWSDLWLNEAFASYMEWFSLDEVEPEWDYRQLFYITDYIPGMNADASITAHPLARTNIDSPSKISYTSLITYQKGSSVLRMFEFVMTKESFTQNLKIYFQKYQYTTVETGNFIETFSQTNVTGLKNTKEFLESWIIKPGFPCLNVEKIDNKTFLITQRRFLSSGKMLNESHNWIVPLSYYIDYSKSNEFQMQFLTDKRQTITLGEEINFDYPIKFNYDSMGFYIVNYPEMEWARWAELFSGSDNKKLDQLKLTSQDYSQLLYDAFRLANVGSLKFDYAMDLLALLKTNRQVSVWKTGSIIMEKMWRYFRDNDNADDETISANTLMKKMFEKFAQDLVKDAYNQLGLQTNTNSSILLQRLQAIIGTFACTYGYDICLTEAKLEFTKWLNGYKTLLPDVEGIVLQFGIESSSREQDWHALWNKYEQEHSSLIRLKYLRALASSTNEKLLYQLLERANNETLVRPQDYLKLYGYLVKTSTGYNVSWNYFQQNYQKIVNIGQMSPSTISKLVNYFADYLYTNDQRKQFQQVFKDKNVKLNRALETIDTNIKWADRYRQIIFNCMKRKTKLIAN